VQYKYTEVCFRDRTVWANRTKVSKEKEAANNEVICLRSAGRPVTEVGPATASPVPCSVHWSVLSKALLTIPARMSKADSY